MFENKRKLVGGMSGSNQMYFLLDVNWPCKDIRLGNLRSNLIDFHLVCDFKWKDIGLRIWKEIDLRYARIEADWCSFRFQLQWNEIGLGSLNQNLIEFYLSFNQKWKTLVWGIPGKNLIELLLMFNWKWKEIGLRARS